MLCPLSVTDGWVSEINRFTPKLEVLRYVGDKDCRRNLRKLMYDHHVNKSSNVSESQKLVFFKLLLMELGFSSSFGFISFFPVFFFRDLCYRLMCC